MARVAEVLTNGMLFQDLAGPIRVMVVGPLAYVALVLFLRLSGKRTLSKMNAFDLVITITLGSTFASVLLSKDVPLAEGLTAFAVLILMQYAVAWLSVRSAGVCRMVKSEPRLLFYGAQFLRDAMRAERMTEGEVLAGVRARGLSSIIEVGAVVLETDGTLSVIPARQDDGSALANVSRGPDLEHG